MVASYAEKYPQEGGGRVILNARAISRGGGLYRKMAAKKAAQRLSMHVVAGKATPSPPLGPALGQV